MGDGGWECEMGMWIGCGMEVGVERQGWRMGREGGMG